MNRKHKEIRIFLVIPFIFFLSVFSAYVYFNTYAEMDFPPVKPTFENPDQDYLLINQENKSFALGQNISFLVIEGHLFQQLLQVSSGIPPLDQRPVVLRC